MISAPSAPACLACFVRDTASAVLLEPDPAMTGMRLLTTSTVSSITRWCSWCERVADSPVVPQGTIPLVPLAICHSMRSPKARSSTLPFRNGVTMAINAPVNMLLLYRATRSSPHFSAEKRRDRFAIDQIVVGLPSPDHVDVSVFDQHLRYSWSRIIIGGHDKSIGPRTHHRQHVARVDLRQ